MTHAPRILPLMQQRLAKTLTVHGRTVAQLLADKRAEYGDLRMGPPPPEDDDKGGTGGQGGGAGGGAGSGAGGTDKTFTQADLDRIAAERADKAGRAERKKLYESLGLPEGAKLEDVKTALAEAEKTRLEQLSETERLKEEKRIAEERAAALEKEREDERKTTTERLHAEKVTGLLVRAGAGAGEEDEKKRDEILARAAKFLAVDIQVGADSDDIRKAIETLKQDSPGLFGAPQTAGGGTGPRGAKTVPAPVVRGKGESAQEAGKALAEKIGWKKPAEKAS